MIHERHLVVSGCSNFRDLGGYLTADGKHRTRWNRLYRSDNLGKMELTQQNIRLLCETLKVKSSIDLRGFDAVQAEPYRIPGVETTKIYVEPGEIMYTLMCLPEILESSVVKAMSDLNELLVIQYRPQYKRFLKVVIAKGTESRTNALVFHCTAGKDRTGYGAALILSLLGVDRATIYEDYLLTNQYFVPPPLDQLLRRMSAHRKVEEEALKALFYVRREYLEKVFSTIDTKFGGVHNYVKTELGITDEEIQQLKDAYLEPA